MKYAMLTLMLLSAASAAQVPNTFSAGQPASAAQVNANFTHVVGELRALEQRLSSQPTDDEGDVEALRAEIKAIEERLGPRIVINPDGRCPNRVPGCAVGPEYSVHEMLELVVQYLHGISGNFPEVVDSRLFSPTPGSPVMIAFCPTFDRKRVLAISASCECQPGTSDGRNVGVLSICKIVQPLPSHGGPPGAITSSGIASCSIDRSTFDPLAPLPTAGVLLNCLTVGAYNGLDQNTMNFSWLPPAFRQGLVPSVVPTDQPLALPLYGLDEIPRPKTTAEVQSLRDMELETLKQQDAAWKQVFNQLEDLRLL